MYMEINGVESVYIRIWHTQIKFVHFMLQPLLDFQCVSFSLC